MPAIQSVVHFSIPVSDVERSTRFYTEIVGCRHLATVAQGTMAFLDAAGTCLILVKRDPPINPRPEDHGGVHHSFAIAHEEYRAALDHLRRHGIEITFEEDRQGGIINGARLFSRPRRHSPRIHRSDELCWQQHPVINRPASRRKKRHAPRRNTPGVLGRRA